MTAVVDVAGVSKSYRDVQAVDDTSFTVHAGEVFGLIGPNGAGKTTTASMVTGLLRPDAGRITVAGLDVWTERLRAQRSIGYAPQETGVHLTLTVRENFSYFAGLFGVRGRDVAARVDWLVERFALGDRLDRRVATLSPGERRQLHVATALVHRPQLLVLDEPTAFLDIPSRQAMFGVLQELAEAGTAVVYSTHVLHEVEEVCSTCLILHQGRPVATGRVADVIAEHGHPAVTVVLDDDIDEVLLSKAAWCGIEVTAQGRKVVIRSTDVSPEKLLVQAMDLLRPIGTVASVTMVQPSLEAAFLALVGRTVEAAQHDEEAT